MFAQYMPNKSNIWLAPCRYCGFLLGEVTNIGGGLHSIRKKKYIYIFLYISTVFMIFYMLTNAAYLKYCKVHSVSIYTLLI